MRKLLTFAVLAAIAGAVQPAAMQAQDPVPATPVAITPEAREAASELLRLLDLERIMQASFEVTIDQQIAQQPFMAPFREVMREWAGKYLTWEHFGPRMIQIYAEAFTAEELRELVAFYHTPVGRKLAAATPELTRKGMVAGAEIAAEHVEELQRMIQSRAAELDPPPPE